MSGLSSSAVVDEGEAAAPTPTPSSTTPTPKKMLKAASTASTVASTASTSVEPASTNETIAAVSAVSAASAAVEQQPNSHAGQHKELKRLSVVDTATLREIIPNGEPIVLDVRFCLFLGIERVCGHNVVLFVSALSLKSCYQLGLCHGVTHPLHSPLQFSYLFVLTPIERMLHWTCDAAREDAGR
jgi:hypothetical protein